MPALLKIALVINLRQYYSHLRYFQLIASSRTWISWLVCLVFLDYFPRISLWAVYSNLKEFVFRWNVAFWTYHPKPICPSAPWSLSKSISMSCLLLFEGDFVFPPAIISFWVARSFLNISVKILHRTLRSWYYLNVWQLWSTCFYFSLFEQDAQEKYLFRLFSS